jgi:fibronectin type 3 domain-containing protein
MGFDDRRLGGPIERHYPFWTLRDTLGRLKADGEVRAMTRRVVRVAMSVAVMGSVAVVAGSTLSAGPSFAAGSPTRAGNTVMPLQSAGHAVSRPLHSLPPEASTAGQAHASLPVQHRSTGTSAPTATGSLQSLPSGVPAPPSNGTFEGVGNLDSVLPPDTNGAVGGQYYVQWVNLHYAVFNKATGAQVLQVAGKQVFANLNNACSTTNQGDPIVQYDKLAQRWVLTQFAFGTSVFGQPKSPYLQCVAVSQTSDPTGAYWLYSWNVGLFNGANYFPDYPKLAVWPDGYYLTFNYFGSNLSTFYGAGMVVLQRNVMLVGGTANAVGTGPIGAAYDGLLAADVDGVNPPAEGAPESLFGIDSTSSNGSNALYVWHAAINWATVSGTFGAANFAPNDTLSVDWYNWELCGGSRNCIPQPGTNAGLDPLSDRLLYRAAYRNFGTYEAVVLNHTVNVSQNGGDHAGIRWYVVDNVSGSSPTVAQQGSYAPDGDNRWMGSIAMDHQGDLALGFSVSSSATSPSIRFTGRATTDTSAGLEAETSLYTGSGSQTSTSYRWGDYSAMSVDPIDDCTFWYTNEYYPATASYAWHTRFGSFKFSGCTATGAGSAPVPAAPTQLAATSPSGTEIDLSWHPSGGATSYTVLRSTNGTSYTPIAAGIPYTTFADTGLASGGTYWYEVEATDLNGTSGPSTATSQRAGAANTPPAAPSGLTATTKSSTEIDLSWNPDANTSSYNVLQLISGTYTQIASGIASTSYPVTTGLSAGTSYSFEVVATNGFGPSNPSSPASAMTDPTPPTGLKATAASSSEIDLTWNAPTGASSYDVFRSTDGTNFGQIATPSAASYQDTGLTSNTKYWYQVEAIDSGGPSALTASVSTTTLPGPPAPPSGVTATSKSSTEIDLSWNPDANTNSYNVLELIGGTYTQIASGITGTSDPITGLSAATSYSFEVTATNTTYGTSSPSSPVSATTDTLPPTNLVVTSTGRGSVSLSWTGSTGATSYDVYWSKDGTTWSSLNTTNTAAKVSGLSRRTVYYFYVTAVDAGGQSGPSNQVSAHTS